MHKIRILLVTSMPWREDNNIGNSYSNLFGDVDEFEIAHIYCRSGWPFNNKVKKYFQITESDLIKNRFKSFHATGHSFELTSGSEYANEKEITDKTYNRLRILRWELFFIARDLIWAFGRWKSKELYDFIENFKPDLIFGTLTYMPNINQMMVDIKKRYNIPLVLYSWDDVYSFNHYSLNPLFWIRKIYQRSFIKNSVSNSELLYVISAEMKEEYTRYFNKECKLLYKSYDFSDMPSVKNEVSTPIRLVFMGNIGAGRWKALYNLALALKHINQKQVKAKLDIYTLSPVSEDMIKKLNIKGASCLRRAVPQELVMKTQQDADILVHVEPINKREASFYRLSFSTKLVDYLFNARCILGLGCKTSTLSYIEKNDAGIVVYDNKLLIDKLQYLLNQPELIIDYGKKAWTCGFNNHKREKIKDMLLNDFMNLVK